MIQTCSALGILFSVSRAGDASRWSIKPASSYSAGGYIWHHRYIALASRIAFFIEVHIALWDCCHGFAHRTRIIGYRLVFNGRRGAGFFTATTWCLGQRLRGTETGPKDDIVALAIVVLYEMCEAKWNDPILYLIFTNFNKTG